MLAGKLPKAWWLGEATGEEQHTSCQLVVNHSWALETNSRKRPRRKMMSVVTKLSCSVDFWSPSYTMDTVLGGGTELKMRITTMTMGVV